MWEYSEADRAGEEDESAEGESLGCRPCSLLKDCCSVVVPSNLLNLTNHPGNNESRAATLQLITG